MSSIAAGTSTGTALVSSGDTTGNLVLQVNGTTPSLTLNAAGAHGMGASPSYGTAGQVLTSAGSAATPTWTTPSAGGGMTLLATATPTNGASTLVVTGLANSKQLLIVMTNVVYAASSSTTLELSSDNGTNYGTANVISFSNIAILYEIINIYNTNVTNTKILWPNDRSGASPLKIDTVTTGVINALRLSTASTYTGVGTVYIYGMN